MFRWRKNNTERESEKERERERERERTRKMSNGDWRRCHEQYFAWHNCTALK